MSHTARVPLSGMTNKEAIFRACELLGLAVPQERTVAFFDHSTAHGIAVKLPGWLYPVVVGEDGQLTYDNYGGSWGSEAQLDLLRQHYALAVTLGAMPDHQFQYETLPEGDIEVTLWQ